MHAVALDGIGKGKFRGLGPKSCVWFDVFIVIFWIVLLRFLMLSCPMSLLVFLNFPIMLIFEVFLCHLQFCQFFKISWLCHLSVYVFLRYHEYLCRQ